MAHVSALVSARVTICLQASWLTECSMYQHTGTQSPGHQMSHAVCRSHDGATTVSSAMGPSLFSEWTAHHQRLRGMDTVQPSAIKHADTEGQQMRPSDPISQSAADPMNPEPNFIQGSPRTVPMPASRLSAVDRLSLEVSKAQIASMEAPRSSTLDHATAAALTREWLQYLADSRG